MTSGARANLSTRARNALDEFQVEYGVSFSGLIEGLAQAIIQGEDLTTVALLARQVDAQRRQR